MIITLMGADFSKSNIGTLSTWRISRSLGAGATYEGPTNIDKGAAFSATVTLAEGYIIGTAGITVTMGGTALSGAHSISGNVITITIAEVTGNVLIKVPTINTATGEEEEPEVPDTPDETGLSYKLNRNIDTTGIIHPYIGRIAIADFFETNGAAVTVSHSNGLRVVIRYYDENKVFTSDANASTYCRIILLTENQGTTDNDGTALTSDTVKNTTLTINGTVHTLTNKIEETQLMYFINTNLSNKEPFLGAYNERITIDDGFWTNGTDAEITYNGSKFTLFKTVAKRYFDDVKYVTNVGNSTNVRCVLVGRGGATNTDVTSGKLLTDSNMLDGDTITVNGTVYSFI